MTDEKLRVLIVDDTALYRIVLTDVFKSFPEVEVTGTAANGKQALEKIKELKPDVVSLDVEMPVMNGIETLKHIKSRHPDIEVVMVSAITTEGAQITIDALNLGAYDFITKPDKSNPAESIEHLQNEFRPKIEALLWKRRKTKSPAAVEKERKPVRAVPTPSVKRPSKAEVIAIGISTGGPKALVELIPKLPHDFSTPILIVQHMPALFTKALADSLQAKSKLNIQEAEDGMAIQKGNVYIAPGGRQMKVVTRNLKNSIKITDDPPENFCKPSADYLFRSVATVYKEKALGVIMTGMGKDGTIGLRLMKRYGARIIAQDEQSSVVFGMPAEAIKAGVVDSIVSLDNMADKIIQLAASESVNHYTNRS